MRGIFTFLLVLVFFSGKTIGAAQTALGLSGDKSLPPTLVSFDVSTPDDRTPLHTLSDVKGSTVSASDGTTYYIYYGTGSTLYYYIVDIGTGATEVKQLPRSSGQPGYELLSATYDAATGKLYAIENPWGVDGSTLYEIDPAAGELTAKATLDRKYSGIASDGEGGFYFVELQDNTKPAFYKTGADFGAAETVREASADLAVGYMYGGATTMAVNEGKLYMIRSDYDNTYLITLDPATSEAGCVKTGILTGIAFAGKTGGEDPIPPVPADPAERLMTHTVTYTTATADAEDVKSRTDYFYDSGYRLTRESYLKMNSKGELVFDGYKKNEYDDGGHLVKSVYYNNVNDEYGSPSFVETNNDTYKYDDNGLLVESQVGLTATQYEYDENGQLRKETITRPFSGAQTLEYGTMSETLKYVFSTSADDNDTWMETWTLDDKGRVTVKERKNKFFEPKQKETYTYGDDGKLAVYELYVGTDPDTNDWLPAERKEYTRPEGDTDTEKRTDYEYADGEWKPVGSAVDEYADFRGMAEKTDVAVTVSVDDKKLNTAVISFARPADSRLTTDKANIYRNGELLKTIAYVDYWDHEGTGDIVVTDEELRNGSYEYFVQPLVSSGNPGAGGALTFAAYNVYVAETVTFNLELPAATGLEIKSIRPDRDDPAAAYASIGWTAPQAMADYGWESNGLFYEKASTAEAATTDAGVSELEGHFTADITNVYVISRYKYGVAKSEPLAVELSALLLYTGIDNATVSEDGVSFDGKAVNVSGDARVAVYSLGGSRVAASAGSGRMELGRLPEGTYVVTVESGGKTKAYKVILK